MSSLPRNLLNKNRIMHLKTDNKRYTEHELAMVAEICNESNVFEIKNISNVKFIDANGNIDILSDNCEVYGNLKYGVYLFRYDSMINIPNITHDIITLRNKMNKPLKQSTQSRKDARKFVENMGKKLIVKECVKYVYAEIKYGMSDMVIENVNVFSVKPAYINDRKYIICCGDFQIKSGHMKEIDPNYKIDNVLDSQYELIEKIKGDKLTV